MFFLSSCLRVHRTVHLGESHMLLGTWKEFRSKSGNVEGCKQQKHTRRDAASRVVAEVNQNWPSS